MWTITEIFKRKKFVRNSIYAFMCDNVHFHAKIEYFFLRFGDLFGEKKM